ncbi:hypothetical protein Goe16_01620 [Bacillus phage vB_BsuM-Goe16]|nr:hypothetical protein Goe16_01620 [Bacillus phage vB_BsuM-Goe16]
MRKLNEQDPTSMFKAVRMPPKLKPWEIDNKRRKGKRKLTGSEENPRYVHVEEFWSIPLYYTVDLEKVGTDEWNVYGSIAEDMSIYDDLAEWVERYNEYRSKENE